MNGWMFEMWFFASLSCGLFDSSDEELQTWSQLSVSTLDVKSFPTLPLNKGVWYKPSKWNQGGYDAIFLEKGSGLVRFVQVTAGNTHSFKIRYFRCFLDSLGESTQSFEVTKLEIYFVVDQKNRSTFRLSQPTELGMLEEYGWNWGEEMNNVKIVYIKGWND